MRAFVQQTGFRLILLAMGKHFSGASFTVRKSFITLPPVEHAGGPSRSRQVPVGLGHQVSGKLAQREDQCQRAEPARVGETTRCLADCNPAKEKLIYFTQAIEELNNRNIEQFKLR